LFNVENFRNMSLPQKFRDWAALARLPNVPTVWSNVFTAWAFAGGTLVDFHRTGLWLSLLGGTLLYIGGTVLNDVNDVAFDRQHRPERPIPSGRIARGLAGAVAMGLMLGGLAVFWLAHNHLALLLAILIVLYTQAHKKLPAAGMFLMGLCRLMLAYSVYVSLQNAAFVYPWQLRHVPASWWCAIFLYVFAISALAQKETGSRARQAVGWMLAALPVLDASFLFYAGLAQPALVPLGCAILAWWLRRVASAT
jgi:4-hydroxybenzoate polyprenyltransferase